MISGGGFTVSAAETEGLPPDGRFLTYQDTYELYGDSIPVQYYNGNSYVSVSATSDFSGSRVNGYLNTSVGRIPVVWFQVLNLGDLSLSPDSVTIELNPQYSLYNTYYIYQAVGMSSSYSISSSVYSSPSWLYSIAGSDRLFEGVPTNGMYTGSTDLSPFFGSTWSSVYMSGVEVNYLGNTLTYGFSKRIRFYGNAPSQWQNLVFYISCPYISQDAYSSSGVPATTALPDYGGEIASGIQAGNAQQSVIASQQMSQQQQYYEGTTETVETLASLDYSALEQAMTADIYDDLPVIVAASGFWVYLLGRLLDGIPFLITFFAPFMCLSLVAWLLWRK